MAEQLGLDVIQAPITSTGGNVLVDRIGTALSTCILLTENRYNGVMDEGFLQLAILCSESIITMLYQTLTITVFNTLIAF